MNYGVTVRTQWNQIRPWVQHVAWINLRNGGGVMHLDQSCSNGPVSALHVTVARHAYVTVNGQRSGPVASIPLVSIDLDPAYGTLREPYDVRHRLIFAALDLDRQ